MQREVWFDKVAWSYMPCHPKGIAVMMAVILPTVIAIILGQMACDRLGYSSLDWLPFPVFFIPAYLTLVNIAERHS